MILRFLLFICSSYLSASSDDSVRSVQAVDVSVVGLDPADYLPYERPYLEGKYDYDAFIDKETQVVHYVPKTPEVLEAFCDELIEEAKNRSPNPEVFSAKVGVVRAKGCITELDIRDLFLDLSVSVSTPDDCTKVWGIFSGEFLLNYQFVLVEEVKKIDFNAFWNPIRIKLEHLIKLQILHRVDYIKQKGANLNAMLSKISGRNIVRELYPSALRLFDKVLRVADDIEKIINEDIQNFKKRYEEEFKVQIRLEELLACGGILEIFKYLSQNTFLYLFPDYLLFDPTIRVNKETIVKEINEKAQQRAKKHLAKYELQKNENWLQIEWNKVDSQIAPDNSEVRTDSDKTIRCMCFMKHYDDFIAKSSQKLGIFLKKNMQVCPIEDIENDSLRQKLSEERLSERQQALAELGLSPEDLHPKKRARIGALRLQLQLEPTMMMQHVYHHIITLA